MPILMKGVFENGQWVQKPVEVSNEEYRYAMYGPYNPNIPAPTPSPVPQSAHDTSTVISEALKAGIPVTSGMTLSDLQAELQKIPTTPIKSSPYISRSIYDENLDITFVTVNGNAVQIPGDVTSQYVVSPKPVAIRSVSDKYVTEQKEYASALDTISQQQKQLDVAKEQLNTYLATPDVYDPISLKQFKSDIISAQQSLDVYKKEVDVYGTDLNKALTQYVTYGGLTDYGVERSQLPKYVALSEQTQFQRGIDLARNATLQGKENITVTSEKQQQGADYYLAQQAELDLQKKFEIEQQKQADEYKLTYGGLTPFGEIRQSTPEMEKVIQQADIQKGIDLGINAMLQGKTEIDSKFIKNEDMLYGVNTALFGRSGLTPFGEVRQSTPEMKEIIDIAERQRGVDTAMNALLQGKEDFKVRSENELYGANVFLASQPAYKISEQKAKEIFEMTYGGQTEYGKALSLTPEKQDIANEAERQRGRDKANTWYLGGGVGEIVVNSKLESEGVREYFYEQSLSQNPDAKTTSLTSSDLQLTPEQQLESAFGGTVSGDLYYEGKKQEQLALERQKQGNVLGGIFAGTAGTLLQVESGIVAPFESMLEILPENYRPDYFRGKNVPDIFGALIGSGIKSYEEGKLTSDAEATFLQQNPLYSAGSVVGEILLGAGIGGVLKKSGSGAAKVTTKISRIGPEGSTLSKITGIPINVLEKFGVGGSKAELLTSIKQKGVIYQPFVRGKGERFSKVVTELVSKDVKLTYREAEKLKALSTISKDVGVEFVGLQKSIVRGGKGSTYKLSEGVFDITGKGVESKLKNIKKFVEQEGRPGVKLASETYVDDLIDLVSKKSGASSGVSEEVFTNLPTPLTRKVVSHEGFNEKYLDVVNSFLKKSPIPLPKRSKVAKTIQFGEKDFSLFKEGYAEFLGKTSGQTIKKTKTIHGGLGFSKKTTEKITTYVDTSKIKGFPSTEGIIKFEAKGKVTGIIGERIHQVNDIFKEGTIIDGLTFKPKKNPILDFGENIVKQGNKKVDLREYGLKSITKGETASGSQKLLSKMKRVTKTQTIGRAKSGRAIISSTITRKGAGLYEGFLFSASRGISKTNKTPSIASKQITKQVTPPTTKMLTTIKPKTISVTTPKVTSEIISRITSVTTPKITFKPFSVTTPSVKTVSVTTPKLSVTQTSIKDIGLRIGGGFSLKPITDVNLNLSTIVAPKLDIGTKPDYRKPPATISQKLKIDTVLRLDLDLLRIPMLKELQLTKPQLIIREDYKYDYAFGRLPYLQLKTPRVPEKLKPKLLLLPEPPFIEYKRKSKKQYKDYLKSLKKHPVNYDPLGLFTELNSTKSSKSPKNRERKK